MTCLSLIRSGAIATVTAIALAACTNQSGMSPSSPTTSTGVQNTLGSWPALTTCATSPPQYEWIFKGACDKFTLEASGGHFMLSEYQGISVNGFIGANALKRPAKMAFADAIDKNRDVEKFQGDRLPRYKARGTTYVYLTTINESRRVIKFVTVKGKPEFEYTITNAKGFGSNTKCGWAILLSRNGKPSWFDLPSLGTIKAKTVKLRQYVVPKGFTIPPKTPLYLAVNCYS